MKRLVIVQDTLPEYRIDFFRLLSDVLARSDVHLQVIYSNVSATEQAAAQSHPVFVKKPKLRLLRGRLNYQPVLTIAFRSDLIIVEQASRHLLNYVLFLLRPLGRYKVALWGHGRDENAGPAAARWRRFWLQRPDWWFSYTEGVTQYVADNGYPANRITTVRNSNDVAGFRKSLNSIKETELDALSQRIGLTQHSIVGLYCGSMYTAKAIPFLLGAVNKLTWQYPDFHLLVIGTGADSDKVSIAAAQSPNIHFAGAAYGREKALYFRRADIFLHPGVIGLAILEALTAGLPVLTTDTAGHGPELEYMTPGVSGMITRHDVEAFSNAVARLIQDDTLRATLQENARKASLDFGLASMIENFATGIKACLGVKH